MRRQSLRPRQIDIHARMRIIRSAADLVVDDEPSSSSGGGNSAGSTSGSAVSAATLTTFEDLVANLDDGSAPSTVSATTATIPHGAAKPPLPKPVAARKKQIPTPLIATVASYDDDNKDDFMVPTSYVRFQALPMSTVSTSNNNSSSNSSSSNAVASITTQDSDKVEMDLSMADMQWLARHPKYGHDGDPRYQLPLEKLERMLDVLEKACVLINPNVITLAEAEEALATQMGMVKTPLNKVTVDVYNYWAQKRLALKRPLLRKYWPQTPLNDTNPHLVFRPREKERYKLRKHRKNDMDGYRKLQQLHADFERVRHLMDLIKRREKAKRLAIDFVDEMRRQAVYELTNRTGVVRKPVMPVDDDRDAERIRKRKKKKKKTDEDHEDGGVGSLLVDSALGMELDDLPRGEPSTKAGATSAVGDKSTSNRVGATVDTIPTFMEYDTSANYTMRDEHDPDLTMPYYPSYPLPSSHLMAAIFMQPPKYRCRGRIGRGGRMIIDRIPVPTSRFYTPSEIHATTREFANRSADHKATTDSTPLGVGLGEAINSGLHAAILVHETAFRPNASKMASVTTKRLEEIYAMSDSEDELLEPLTSSVFETTTSRKSSSSTSSAAKTHALAVQNNRQVKFALNI